MIVNANALHIPLADNSVHCVITSPPYYGLRDYGTARWEGGDPECKHYICGDGEPGETSAELIQQGNKGSMRKAKDVCPRCGAVRIDDQIGLEQTPEEYIENLVQVFREVKRILKDDGTLWLNIGDSYTGNMSRASNGGAWFGPPREGVFNRGGDGLKPKDLIGIPWMLAFALRADGWYLRQDIIWHKPNPMPESVKDRCTKAHEYIFLLTKAARYYYDCEAISEPSKYPEDDRGARTAEEHKRFPTKVVNGIRASGVYPKRNRRTVWTVPTRPYKGAHYATFPPNLVEPMILAGCPQGGIVFDPFVGSGTVVMVARKHGREGIGLDLNYAYIKEQAVKRIQIQPLLSMAREEMRCG